MKEFIALMAYLTAMVALSIDAMLPALPAMGQALAVVRENDMQYVVTFIFIGMTIGQVAYGPLSDTIGRKPALFIGLSLFMAGSICSALSSSLPVMLFGRFIQGLGVAGPRIVTMAVVRDRYEGREMAYVMSMVMGVFIMVPAIAPALGQLILHLYGWRAIFVFYVAAALVAALWAHLRLAETLTREHRRPFSLVAILSGFKEAATTRATLGYTLCSGLSFGAILSYLNAAPQIFHNIYHSGDLFALYFSLLALCIGAAFFTNSALVRKHGMRHLTTIALRALMLDSAFFLAYHLFAPPPLVVFMLFMGIAFFSMGLMFGNLASLALAPMGHMAGLASAFNGALSSLLSLTLGMLISQQFNETLLPLAIGFMTLSVATWLTMRITERGQRF